MQSRSRERGGVRYDSKIHSTGTGVRAGGYRYIRQRRERPAGSCGREGDGARPEVWAAEYGTPTGPIAAYWSQNGWRPQNVIDAVFDEYYENALAATTREEQQEWARKADLRVAEQLWVIRGPLAPLFGASQPWIKGYIGETDLGLNAHKTWLAYVWVDQDLKREMGF